MSDAIINALFSQLGLAGLMIGGQWVAMIYLWKALAAERQRSEHLVDKMLEMTSDASTMIERITGRN